MEENRDHEDFIFLECFLCRHKKDTEMGEGGFFLSLAASTNAITILNLSIITRDLVPVASGNRAEARERKRNKKTERMRGRRGGKVAARVHKKWSYIHKKRKRRVRKKESYQEKKSKESSHNQRAYRLRAFLLWKRR